MSVHQTPSHRIYFLNTEAVCRLEMGAGRGVAGRPVRSSSGRVLAGRERQLAGRRPAAGQPFVSG